MSVTTHRKRKPRGRLTVDQQRLAEQYLPLARRMAQPMKKRNPTHWEEYESAACLALVEAAEAFQPDRHVKFATYAQQRIWGALKDVTRRRQSRARTLAKVRPILESNAPVYCEEGKGHVLLVQPHAAVGAEFESTDAAESWFRKLPRGHAAACREIYMNGKTHAEAAESLGLSASRVTYIHLEAMAMLNGTWEGRRPAPKGRLRPN